MLNEKRTATQEFPSIGRTEKEESTLRCHAGKKVVEKYFSNITFTEAFQKVKAMEKVLETLQENGISTVEAALESIRIAGAVSAYLCTDGSFSQEKAARLNRADG